MAQPDDDWLEDELPDGTLDEIRRLSEKSNPQFPYFGNDRAGKVSGELDKVQDWAAEMEERGHLVTGIRPTCDDQGRLDDPRMSWPRWTGS